MECDFGCDCEFAMVGTTSASPTGVLVPDHKPPEGDAVPLVVLCMNLELDPELMVRRMLLIELFQVLYGSPSEKGVSDGVLAFEDPVKRRR